ncbi:MAG: hypothetical protein ACW99F_00265 [Candidatus Hodarchaeales archaeon]|jgi:hypothetical protein
MWEWRIFCDTAITSLFSNHQVLEEKLRTKLDEIRLDKYTKLETPKIGLKFRDIGQDINKAWLELKILIKTKSWGVEFWEKPIVRYSSFHPTKEVIYRILNQESHHLKSEIQEKIHWIKDYFSENSLRFMTVQKKRKKLYLSDPNKVLDVKFKIPKAHVKIEQTMITFNQMTWKTISIESYNVRTIKGIIDNFELDNRYIVSGYPSFLVGRFTANNNQ